MGITRIVPLRSAIMSGAILTVLLLVSVGWSQTRRQFDAARKQMVEQAVAGAGVTDERVIQAMLKTHRHEFVLPKYRRQAYQDSALPIGDKQTISSPFIVAFMTQSLDPQPSDKVLEIGTGSGYQAAVLSPLVEEVYSIEIVESLGKRAAQTLKRLKYKNVFTKVGDGYKGWPEHAPFDKIIVTCSPEKVPQDLVDQLKEGGLLVIPVGQRYQQTLYVMRKKDGELQSEALRPTLFVPMTGIAEAQREVQPDPSNPEVVNGDFEIAAEKEGFVEGWYYQRQMKREKDPNAPGGDFYITFENRDPGRAAHLMQGLPLDGSIVKSITLSAHVKTEATLPGPGDHDMPLVALSFYDENRRDLGAAILGPFFGSQDWRRESRQIDVPPLTKEAIIRIGLFGGTGKASFDRVSIKANRQE